jgi:hypothetical protein
MRVLVLRIKKLPKFFEKLCFQVVRKGLISFLRDRKYSVSVGVKVPRALESQRWPYAIALSLGAPFFIKLLVIKRALLEIFI